MSLKCADDLFFFCVVFFFFFFLGCSFVLCFLFVVLPLAVTDALCVDSNSGVAFIGANTGASFHFVDVSILIQLEQPIALWEG